VKRYVLIDLQTGAVRSVDNERIPQRFLRDEGVRCEVFDDEESCETDPRVAAWRLRRWAEDAIADAGLPGLDARSMKADEARRWRTEHPTDDGAPPDADDFPMLEIAYRVRGRSADAESRAILAAIRRDADGNRGAVAVEEERAARKDKARRFLRSPDAHLDMLPHDDA